MWNPLEKQKICEAFKVIYELLTECVSACARMSEYIFWWTAAISKFQIFE